MHFPMYTVAAERVLEMTEICPHEELKAGRCSSSVQALTQKKFHENSCLNNKNDKSSLLGDGEMSKARGDVIVFEEAMGNAGFVSHEWVAKQHPDPEFKQMKVLQDALQYLLKGHGLVPLDVITESLAPSAKSIPLELFQSRPLFLWYDYFSVPQLEQGGSEGDKECQAEAISSIPAYVVKCRFFLALCATIESPFEGKVLSFSSWANRGWCRLERASRALSENDSWVVIKSPAALEVAGTALSWGSVGEGEFTVQGDIAKIAPVMEAIVKRKLILSLQAGDFPSYRRHLNLQAVHLRGLNVEPVSVLPCRIGCNSAKDEVASFLYENGLTKVNGRDSAGWWPLHYAAMSGKLSLMKALLGQRADPNRRTMKDEPQLGLAPWLSALDLTMLWRQNDAARLLIDARAELSGGMQPAMVLAASANNVEGIRLLCAAGGNPLCQNMVGFNGVTGAASCNSLAALDELVKQANPSKFELSRALFLAMGVQGGSAELVERLVSLRADVDFQFDARYHSSLLGRFFYAVKSVQHRYGTTTAQTAMVYHCYGITPLMAALQSAQYEGAAALIAAGARLDIKNCRGWAAADFARGHAIPEWLQKGLQGDPSECQRVSSVTIPDRHIEVHF